MPTLLSPSLALAMGSCCHGTGMAPRPCFEWYQEHSAWLVLSEGDMESHCPVDSGLWARPHPAPPRLEWSPGTPVQVPRLDSLFFADRTKAPWHLAPVSRNVLSSLAGGVSWRQSRGKGSMDNSLWTPGMPRCVLGSYLRSRNQTPPPHPPLAEPHFSTCQSVLSVKSKSKCLSSGLGKK